MTNRYTNEEWASIIKRTHSCTPEKKTKYTAPMIGSLDFAKCIDHTLLKIDSTKEQIDRLCEEARRYNFKVRFPGT